MEDERGVYYLMIPGNPDARVYARYGDDGEIQFRCWEREHPEVWENHQWLSMNIIRKAAALYKKERNPNADPCRVYDEAIARNLLKGKK